MERLTREDWKETSSMMWGKVDALGIEENIKKDMKDILKKLAEYEDLEEQGLLLKLPCAVGQNVYEVYRFLDEGALEIDVHKIRLEDLEKIGEKVFLTRAEAEEALRKMKNGTTTIK